MTRFRCPACGSVEKSEPIIGAISITCTCGMTFWPVSDGTWTDVPPDLHQLRREAALSSFRVVDGAVAHTGDVILKEPEGGGWYCNRAMQCPACRDTFRRYESTRIGDEKELAP